ncbi:molybdopterin synthase catalytic subunit MoaE [Paraglaciecola aquimarina]|uniref:Molybdopterin synthase catalytic subunit n=1 Tax=Paraglaciecola algarum TaxID=3050085 RepID=A0ABS9DBI9_9ALTE|nr:molybdopterin synthase catalytic subunit MoaE [Paraglaciecola sp. G1-23]MCF2949001.1 molybdopterin synthase catalytic subunit MoaE [Paraglaciecola sp. G1-23]
MSLSYYKQTVIRVQTDDFNLAAEYKKLRDNNPKDGAIVTFVGLVRDFNQSGEVSGLFLEHYPAMTEKSLAEIVDQARSRWSIGRVTVIHRVGQLNVSEQIVFVGVSSQHRQEAFHANEFIMDFLKTQAPFWKKENSKKGDTWVQAKVTDQYKAKNW